MANINWPASLPQNPLLSSFGEEGQASRWTFEPDGGPSYARPAGRKGDKLRVTFLMTPAQAATFKSWFHNTVREGVLCFNWWDAGANVSRLVRFSPSASSPYSVSVRA
ncbi:MAG: hypothetical protein IKX79_05990 [Desulfovibrionaceae bacterium]|nr:hypothetical protein [Desulfovibrionaceae bacterium]